MNPQLPAEAADFGAAAEKAFVALGAVEVARRAEFEPTTRAEHVATVLRSLGIDDLDPREDLESAAAACELCRVAGRAVLPYPLAAALLRGDDGNPTAVVHAEEAMVLVDHGDLFGSWNTITPEGNGRTASPTGSRLGSRLGPFVARMETTGVTGPGNVRDSRDAALSLILTGWRILGCLQRALELAVDHVRDREQFGQKLSEFQAVQFQLADAAVSVIGLDELCRFTTWRAFSDPARAITDALALRLFALDTARSVLRTTQQLHGAAGVCDEYDISVLARHIQPDLRLPFGSTSTTVRLAAAVERTGFEALFPQGGVLG